MKPFSQRPLVEWIKTLQEAASFEDRYHALLAVNSMGAPSEAIEWNRYALKDADSGIRARAARQLGEWKLRDVAELPGETWSVIGRELVDRLSDDDPDVRFEAARALGVVDPKVTPARDVLWRLLDDSETQPLMIAAVVSALAMRQDLEIDAMLPRLALLLGHSQAEVREAASFLVAQQPAAASAMVNELLVALDDDEPIVRENAAIALGCCGADGPQVRSALSTASQDDDEGVAAAAQEAQRRLTNR